MSFNGSGVFNINTAGQPVVTGTTISSTTFNNLTADLATGLTTTLTKDGQSTPTANIGLGTYKIVNLGAGTVASDAARLDQVQGGAATFITVTGTDTLTGTVVPALSAYATGNQFSFLVANTNTGAVTINVDGIGSKAITRTGTTALVAGDMVAGQAVEIIYDGTRFQLVNGNSFTNLKVSGTLGVTGVATFTAQPIVSSLTASLPVFTDASKGLVSNTMTGTGSVAMSDSPTFTGTVGAVDITTTGNTILGNASTDTLNVGNGSIVTDGAGNTGFNGTANNYGATYRGIWLNAPAVPIMDFAVNGTRTLSVLATSTTPTIKTVTNTPLIFGTNDTERMRIDSGGNVGIGTASPAGILHTVATNGVNILESAGVSSVGLRLRTNSVDRWQIQVPSGSSDLAIYTGAAATERMRLDTSGNLLLGSTSATGTGALRGSYGTGGITSNFAAGDGALNANTTGSQNVAVGVSALISNTTGAANLAVGYQALGSNVSGSNNLAMGQTALYHNTASNNTAVGYQAMQGASGTSTGANNAALGYQALYANTTGAYNSAMGQSALISNTTGQYNSAFGGEALFFNVSGSNNTAQGVNALYHNTASNNTAVGYAAMFGASGTSTGANNAALGYRALYANTTGSNNVVVGYNALAVATTGAANTAVGYNTGLLLTTGSNNVILGDSITLAAAADGRIGIGRNFTQGVNTSVIIGNGTNRISNSYTVNATWAFSSDERIKNVIGKDTLGLDFINDLEPVTFRWKPSNEVPKELTSRYAEENVQDTDLVMHGLIAQNVKAALDKAGVDTFTGWSEDEDGTQKLGITDLITPMINAINELTARVKQLEGK